MAAYFQELALSFQNPVTAVAQVLGFIPMILGFFVFRPVSRKASIAIKMGADFLSVWHFLLLGQPVGAVINFVNTFRGVCFSQKGKKKWATGLFLPVLFCALTMAGSFLTMKNWVGLLPMVGSCLAVIGYWNTKTTHLRRYNAAGIFLWLVYGIYVQSVSTVLCTCVTLFSISRTEWLLWRENRKERKTVQE